MVDYPHAGRYGPEIFMDANQALMKNKPITVFEKGTSTLATLYTDRTKNTVGDNPFLTDSRGNGSFYAAPGEYDIAYAGHEFTVTVFTDFEDLAIGAPGPQGDPGPPGVPWIYVASTADADPGSGNIRLNNADPASATFLYVDDVCQSGVDVASWLATFDDNDNDTIKGDVALMNGDRTAIILYLVTGDVIDGGTYMKIPVVFQGGGGSLTVDQPLYLSYYRAGALTDLNAADAEALIRGLGFIMSDGSVTDIIFVTPDQYAAIDPKDPTTVYLEAPEDPP